MIYKTPTREKIVSFKHLELVQYIQKGYSLVKANKIVYPREYIWAL